MASTKVDCFIRQAADEPSCKARKRQQEERESGDCSCIDRLLEQSIDTEQQQQQRIALMSHAGSCLQHTRLPVATQQKGGGGTAS